MLLCGCFQHKGWTNHGKFDVFLSFDHHNLSLFFPFFRSHRNAVEDFVFLLDKMRMQKVYLLWFPVTIIQVYPIKWLASGSVKSILLPNKWIHGHDIFELFNYLLETAERHNVSTAIKKTLVFLISGQLYSVILDNNNLLINSWLLNDATNQSEASILKSCVIRYNWFSVYVSDSSKVNPCCWPSPDISIVVSIPNILDPIPPQNDTQV